MSDRHQLNLAARSIDRVRVIRRSMRCFAYGAMGLVPFLGAGLAFQALRLQREVSAEMGDGWSPPRLIQFWVLGLFLLWPVDRWLGMAGVLAVALLLFGVQSWWIWRSVPAESGAEWNPGRRHMVWGVTFAYGGFALSLWAVAVIVYRLVNLEW